MRKHQLEGASTASGGGGGVKELNYAQQPHWGLREESTEKLEVFFGSESGGF